MSKSIKVIHYFVCSEGDQTITAWPGMQMIDIPDDSARKLIKKGWAVKIEPENDIEIKPQKGKSKKEQNEAIS